MSECVSERIYLDRVTKVCSCAMAFDILQGVGRDPCQGLRFDNRLGLPCHAWSQIACLTRTVIIDRRGLDHGANGISIRDRIRETPQNNHAGTASKHSSRGAMVESAAVAIGRKYFVVPVCVTKAVRQIDRDATG